ncbi:unnamed protein product [Ranitomeya imitator]|uniref:Uncharacterized protein n=1 Tax=Ranitomeya imitator TaxID=111125 RepID=A0ABN9LXJ4_9NEOB|nr:unnamed protein product [Ranitomeya imitator]
MSVIWVVCDRFSKMVHLVPLPKLPSSSELVPLFFQNVVRLHGIPENIVSDRGSQFVSRFWRTFCAKMGIDLSFSSAFHPQTNGQTERTNQTLETYLRCFVSADQGDWVTFLPLAEFALNNRASSATLVSPFFCNSGFHPRFSSGQVEPSDCPGVDMVVDRLHQIWSHVVDNLKLSQERAQQFANRRRRVGPRLRVGDLVWLSSRFVPMKVSSPKFKPRFIGPYRILEILNPVSFRLDLPASFAIHNVFHRSLLRKYEVPVVPSLEPPAPVLVEGELEYVVEKILDSRVSRRKLQYLVKWKGYGQEDNSWVVASDVHAADLVRAFHRAQPGRPGGSREGSVTPPQGECTEEYYEDTDIEEEEEESEEVIDTEVELSDEEESSPELTEHSYEEDEQEHETEEWEEGEDDKVDQESDESETEGESEGSSYDVLAHPSEEAQQTSDEYIESVSEESDVDISEPSYIYESDTIPQQQITEDTSSEEEQTEDQHVIEVTDEEESSPEPTEDSYEEDEQEHETEEREEGKEDKGDQESDESDTEGESEGSSYDVLAHPSEEAQQTSDEYSESISEESFVDVSDPSSYDSETTPQKQITEGTSSEEEQTEDHQVSEVTDQEESSPELTEDKQEHEAKEWEEGEEDKADQERDEGETDADVSEPTSTYESDATQQEQITEDTSSKEEQTKDHLVSDVTDEEESSPEPTEDKQEHETKEWEEGEEDKADQEKDEGETDVDVSEPTSAYKSDTTQQEQITEEGKEDQRYQEGDEGEIEGESEGSAADVLVPFSEEEAHLQPSNEHSESASEQSLVEVSEPSSTHDTSTRPPELITDGRYEEDQQDIGVTDEAESSLEPTESSFTHDEQEHEDKERQVMSIEHRADFPHSYKIKQYEEEDVQENSQYTDSYDSAHYECPSDILCVTVEVYL